MKMDIDWHKNCLKNRKSHLDRQRLELDHLSGRVYASAREINIYMAQIRLAEKEGKTGFDEGKYAVNRLKESVKNTLNKAMSRE